MKADQGSDGDGEGGGCNSNRYPRVWVRYSRNVKYPCMSLVCASV